MANPTARDFRLAANQVYIRAKRTYLWVLFLYLLLTLVPLVAVTYHWLATEVVVAVAVFTVALTLLRHHVSNMMVKGSWMQASEDRMRRAEVADLKHVWRTPWVADNEILKLAGDRDANLAGEEHEFKDKNRDGLSFLEHKLRGIDFVMRSQEVMRRVLIGYAALLLLVLVAIWLREDDRLSTFLTQGLPLAFPGLLLLLEDVLSRGAIIGEFQAHRSDIEGAPNATGHFCEHGIQMSYDQLRRRYPPVPQLIFKWATRHLVDAS
ncbi:MAG TPA: hypothetical protein VF364_02190 [Candidatus Limnocylindria bacterium]